MSARTKFNGTDKPRFVGRARARSAQIAQTRSAGIGPAPGSGSGSTLPERLRTVPLLVALVPLASGIVLGTFVSIALYIWIIATVVCAATAWLSRKHRNIAALYTITSILFLGAALARAHTPQINIPRGERLWLELQITDNPVRRSAGAVSMDGNVAEGSRSVSTSGVVGRWQRANGNVLSDDWQPAREKMIVGFDTMYRFEAGDRVIFRGYLNPLDGTANSYSRLMAARGYTGRTYISRYSQPVVLPQKRQNIRTAIARLQSVATERMSRLNFAPDDEAKTSRRRSKAAAPSPRTLEFSDAIAVATAMTIGNREGITPELRSAYSRTGASHLLAVSGLHVGIVFLIVNILLYLLPLFPRGHIIKNVMAVAAIWFYAALTGLSPSAMRAAFMFTGAQAALASSETRNAANIMCGTALVMLAVRPGLLFDISFQLSFLAVTGIMAWFPMLYGLVESRWKLLNALWATLIVGLVASLATMPLVSHTFGVFSPVGIVLNPVVITTAHLIVIFSLIWIAVPIPFLEPVFRWLAGGPAWLQNRVVELTSSVPGAAIEYTMPLWMVFVIYAAMIIFTLRYGRTADTSQRRIPPRGR